MATGEKISPSSSTNGKVAAQNNYVDLDEQRRVALAEIDNAPFSFVDIVSLLLSNLSPRTVDGST